MSEISTKYNPKEVEKKWYDYWQTKGFFKSTPNDKEPYTIVIPPPNVTGVLHMGHMLNNTIQDVLIRKARMEQKNACWIPGTDHASIATEAKVVTKLKEEGIEKNSLTREEFLKHAWEWTKKHGGIILQQLKKLGSSCDWDREAFTMDDIRYESVIRVFIDLHNKGKIYRGYRMINWDPQAKTAVSDEEVIYKNIQQKLFFVKYKIVGEEQFLTIATTRPETIFGDTAICINPNDTRFQNLVGKQVEVPYIQRIIPIIFDEYVDMEFGTGCLKVTPAHDPNDKKLGEKYNLQIIDIFNDNGTLNHFGKEFEGKDRFKVRKEFVKKLNELGFIFKIEDYTTSVGTSERTGAVIEPKISKQWFLSMKEISNPALQNVLNETIKLVPKKFLSTYCHWMENVRDWCISRQLFWGHRIPAWYIGKQKEDYVIAHNEDEALQLARKKTNNFNLDINDLFQEEDVLDTWFSSWIWPISVFDGIRNPNNKEIQYYYPTNVLVTAPEILFFWVARMIISGYEYIGKKPFDTVYLTGIVRDKLGRKMSKSLGNSPDPIKLIETYGADGVRVGMLLTSPAGNDLPFDESLCLQGRNFSNKIWNAFRLLNGWETDDSKKQNMIELEANIWFENKFQKTLHEIEDLFSKYRLSEALMTIYKFIWDDLCSWYLEMIKPKFKEHIDSTTKEQTIQNFEKCLQLIHPFMPFISEEIWHFIRNRDEKDCIIVSIWPTTSDFKQEILNKMDHIQKVISEIRNFRNNKQISPKETLKLIIQNNNFESYHSILLKLANLDSIVFQTDKTNENTFRFIVDNIEYLIPYESNRNYEEEVEIIKKELEYTKGFLLLVMKKLSNKKFVQSAPKQVIDNELVKKNDAKQKIELLEKQLLELK